MRIVRKYISILILALLLSLCFIPISISDTNENGLEFNPDDFEPYGGLDQEQTQYDEMNFTLKGLVWGSQSFKPTLTNLSKVKLYIRKNQERSPYLVVSIRKSLEGEDLALAKLPITQIPTEMQWLELNFREKIIVTPDETYYIVVRAGPIESEVNGGKLEWGIGKNTRYTRGDIHTSEDGGKTWRSNTDLDFCFKTYGENNPPNKPNTPIGQNNGETGISYTYSTNTTDPDEDQIQYKFDWGDGATSDWSSLMPSEETYSTSKIWDNPGIYVVKAKGRDENGVESEWSDNLTVNITKANNPPMAPRKPIGPNTGETGIKYTYRTSTIDENGDQIYYTFDWGDGSTNVVGPFRSLHTATANHSWTADGTYNLKVKAKDTNGKESDWSEPLIVKIKTTNNPPEKPDIPDGPLSGTIGKKYDYMSSTSDPDGDLVRYGWDWNGDGNVDELTNYYASGASVRISHSWNSPGIYHVKVISEDLYGKKSGFSDSIEVQITDNIAPGKPIIISRHSSGIPGVSYMFSASAIDPDDNKIYYKFDWGDGTNSEWSGPYESEDICEVSHIFEQARNYNIRVKAKDENNDESPWSEILLIKISEPRLKITIKEGFNFLGRVTTNLENIGEAPIDNLNFNLSVEYGIFGKVEYEEKTDFLLSVNEEETLTFDRTQRGLFRPIGQIKVVTTVSLDDIMEYKSVAKGFICGPFVFLRSSE